jgi:hypothetical protein
MECESQNRTILNIEPQKWEKRNCRILNSRTAEVEKPKSEPRLMKGRAGQGNRRLMIKQNHKSLTAEEHTRGPG